MKKYRVYFDALHEAQWLKRLDSRLSKATQEPFEAALPPGVTALLKYDRPDVILCDDRVPIIVIERSEEVPTGHNVGQRFGRLVAAAHAGIPCLYFFPFAAFKHGGETRGPRYLNLRLLQALDMLERIHKSLQLALCWPVDSRCELIRTSEKDKQIAVFMNQFLDAYERSDKVPSLSELKKLPATLQALESIDKEMVRISTKNPEYGTPPDSVQILQTQELAKTHAHLSPFLDKKRKETVLYRVGMRYARSDPYTGTAMIYDYIYCRTEVGARKRNLVLHFSNLPSAKWEAVLGRNADRKDVRMYLQVADAILFQDDSARAGGANARV